MRGGFVGLGHNGLAHVEAHLALGRSEVAALRDRSTARLEEAGRRFGVRALFSEAEDMLSSAFLDAVSINTGDAFHARPFLLALAAGKRIFVERPLANTEEDVLARAEAAGRADSRLKIQVGYILRFNPVFETVHALARAGRLGEICFLEADYIHTSSARRTRLTRPPGGTGTSRRRCRWWAEGATRSTSCGGFPAKR